jgi:hypothetical protein
LKLCEDQRWDGGGPGARLTTGGRGPAPSHATPWWGQLAPPLTMPFRLWSPLDGKNLRDGLLFLKTYCKPPPSSKWDREDPGTLSTPYRRGESLPEAFSTTMVASGVMCE